jgi:hypothetical protein
MNSDITSHSRVALCANEQILLGRKRIISSLSIPFEFTITMEKYHARKEQLSRWRFC